MIILKLRHRKRIISTIPLIQLHDERYANMMVNLVIVGDNDIDAIDIAEYGIWKPLYYGGEHINKIKLNRYFFIRLYTTFRSYAV